MADAGKIGEDVMTGLRAAVSIAGPLTGSDLDAINSGVTKLQNTIRNYDRYARSLIAQKPSSRQKRESLDEQIKREYPQSKGWTDKMYKMQFLRPIQRVKNLFRRKQQGVEQVINASVEALTLFKLLCNVVLANSRRFVEISGGPGEQAPEDLQPEEFDPELSSTTQELERRLMPTPATDQHQQQTETNVKRRTRRVQPTGRVESEDEYRTMVAKYSQIVENAKNSVRRHRKSLLTPLASADASTFRLIHSSTRALNDLAKAYAKAATNSRAELAPGSYSAAKAFADALAEIAGIVIESAPLNMEARGMERKRNQAVDLYLKRTMAPKVPEEG